MVAVRYTSGPTPTEEAHMKLARTSSLAAIAAAIGFLLPSPAAAQVAQDSDGALRAPTAEEARALVEAMGESLSQSDRGLAERQLADGAATLDLQGRFESLTLARTEGGRVVTRCTDTAAEADRFLGPARPPLAVEEK
jgi:hypothetical protein